ncbi:MAG: hypothetical protein P4M09_08425 [Devosia sp.]|nr:hypothetical protein [Devosia sp.]
MVTILGGCTTLAAPQSEPTGGVEVQAVIDAIECELVSPYLTHAPYASGLDNYLASIKLDVQVIGSVTDNPNVTLSSTVNKSALKIPLGAGLTNGATRQATLYFDIHVNDVKPSGKFGPKIESQCAGPTRAAFRNDSDGLGLTQWLAQVVPLMDAKDTPVGIADNKAKDAPPPFTYHTLFKAIDSANGEVSFQVGPAAIDIGTPTASNTNQNDLTINFAPDPNVTKFSKGHLVTSPQVTDNIQNYRLRQNPIIQLQPGQTLTVQ